MTQKTDVNLFFHDQVHYKTMKENTGSMCNQINYSKYLLHTLNCFSGSCTLNWGLKHCLLILSPEEWSLRAKDHLRFGQCCCVGNCNDPVSADDVLMCRDRTSKPERRSFKWEVSHFTWLDLKASCAKIEIVWTLRLCDGGKGPWGGHDCALESTWM